MYSLIMQAVIIFIAFGILVIWHFLSEIGDNFKEINIRGANEKSAVHKEIILANKKIDELNIKIDSLEKKLSKLDKFLD